MQLVCYHGTPNPDSLVEHGPDMEHKRSKDVGDLGWGFYCTTIPERAASYGSVVRVVLDIGTFAHVPNPYFLNGLDEVEPRTAEERLFHQLTFGNGFMGTVVAGTGREATARRVRDEFLARGFQGIVTDYKGEVVVFDKAAVLELRNHPSHPNLSVECP
jgi:hypothetical protein